MSAKINTLALAVATLSVTSISHSAGLDRSTQPSWAFTQDGTFAYIEHITIDPTIAGHDAKAPASATSYQTGKPVSDMAEDYHFLNFGAKADVNDRVSLGAYFDQPWGADVQFTGDNNFVGAPTNVINGLYAQTTKALNDAGLPVTINNATDLQNTISDINNQITAGKTQLATAQNTLDQLLKVSNPTTQQQAQITGLQTAITTGTANLQKGQTTLTRLGATQATTNSLAKIQGGTNVTVSSQNFTGLVGVKLGEKKNIQVYGGPAIQKLEGDIHLRGNAYAAASGYDETIPSSTGYGWVAGVAYSKPEIALKASLTYRSEIDHDTNMVEYYPMAPLASGGSLSSRQINNVTVTTPESINLDFQTGLNHTTLLTAKVRYVPWSEFKVTPKLYNAVSKTAKDPATGQQLYPNGLDLLSYSDDAWSAEVGIGKKLSPKWGVSGSVGWDSGAGNPVTSLGPVEGNWNVGLGAKYNITPEWSVSAGAKYLMFGDAKAKLPTGTLVGDFADNDGFVYGLRLSYQKK
ncbi:MULTISPECIES: outer membrane protein transport protein [unclassified Moraxella]|uniref:outer membrane protein transport protein n=1 Tax=unclassified Moraxella TaxID=2685852 RepID=UPI003AF7E496